MPRLKISKLAQGLATKVSWFGSKVCAVGRRMAKARGSWGEQRQNGTNKVRPFLHCAFLVEVEYFQQKLRG